MALPYDVELRKAMDEWIECWRNYTLRHPEQSADLEWREKKYQEIISILESRK